MRNRQPVPFRYRETFRIAEKTLQSPELVRHQRVPLRQQRRSEQRRSLHLPRPADEIVPAPFPVAADSQARGGDQFFDAGDRAMRQELQFPLNHADAHDTHAAFAVPPVELLYRH